MRKWFDVKAKKRASLNASIRAKKRWAKWRADRELMDSTPVGGEVVEHWVRLRPDGAVFRERFVYEHDLERDWRRKKRELFA